MSNKKSDVDAKEAYCVELEKKGFTNIAITAHPSDIIAEKDGKKWYFEIKKTSREDKYFGAATITEWEQAILTPEVFRFVVAKAKSDGAFEFIEFTPAEFIKYSTIPPFKVFFNIDLNNLEKGIAEDSKSIKADEANLTALIDMLGKLRNS